MYLIIKYFKEDLAQLASFTEKRSPGALSPLAGKSRWLSVSMIFLQVSGGKGPGGWPAQRTQGSENKGGAACNISHKAASWNFIIFFTSPARSFTTQTQVYSLCLRQEKGKWGEDAFISARPLLICLSHSHESDGFTNLPQWSYQPRATCSNVGPSFKGVPTKTL